MEEVGLKELRGYVGASEGRGKKRAPRESLAPNCGAPTHSWEF